MLPEESRDFQKTIYHIVRQIPQGSVLTYGAIAMLAGRPQNARLVGRMLMISSDDINAHRVVNHKGRTVPSWPEQQILLHSEGVTFKENGCVDLRKHLWRIKQAQTLSK